MQIRFVLSHKIPNMSKLSTISFYICLSIYNILILFQNTKQMWQNDSMNILFKNVQKCFKFQIWNCPETASKDCASLASGLSASADVKTVKQKKHEYENFENVFEKTMSCYIPSYPVPTLHIEINVKLPTPAPQSVAQRVVALVAGTTLVPWFQWSVRTGSDISDKSHPKSTKKSENREKTS